MAKKREEADLGSAQRHQRGTIVVERHVETDANDKVTGTTDRARDAYPTALHQLAALPYLHIGDDLVRVGEELQELAQKAGLVPRQGPAWARSSMTSLEMSDGQALALQRWQAAINCIRAPIIRTVVRNVCCCDEMDRRGGFLRLGLELIKRHWGW